MTAQIPSPRFLCDMWGGRCGRPAHLIVDATVRIGATYEPLTWLVCDDLRCMIGAAAHAEMIGGHVDSRPLTVAEAEALTRVKAGAA